MDKKIRAIGAIVLVVLWAVLTGFAWFSPAKDISEAERRPLDQFPELTADTLLSGKFMSAFEDYTLDQFPARDTFRQLKSLFHYYVLNQKDNNDIYIADGYAAKLDYPLNTEALTYATGRLNWIYENYLKDTGSNVFFAAVPDKGYYLAAPNGYPTPDYNAMFDLLQQQMPWATHIDITDKLEISDYYYTDTHWRQENLLDAATTILEAMDMPGPQAEEFTKTAIDRPFYGVYYGQAALPMDAETLYIMESQRLSGCRVYNYETQGYTNVYNMEMLSSKDLYDIYLSGAQSLLRIENPNATTDRELIIFRDSFGSSIAPLLVSEYKTVTLVDIRYLSSQMVKNYIAFTGQDVLLLYSTLVLNNGTTLK